MLLPFDMSTSLFLPLSGARVAGTEGATILANVASWSSVNELLAKS